MSLLLQVYFFYTSVVSCLLKSWKGNFSASNLSRFLIESFASKYHDCSCWLLLVWWFLLMLLCCCCCCWCCWCCCCCCCFVGCCCSFGACSQSFWFYCFICAWCLSSPTLIFVRVLARPARHCSWEQPKESQLVPTITATPSSPPSHEAKYKWFQF